MKSIEYLYIRLSETNILFYDIYWKACLVDNVMAPTEHVIYGFNGIQNISITEITLVVVTGPITINTCFDAINTKSSYTGKLERKWIHRMHNIPSKQHKNIEFHTLSRLTEIDGNQKASRKYN